MTHCSYHSLAPCRPVCAYRTPENQVEMFYVDYVDQPVHPYEVLTQSCINECTLSEDGTWFCNDENCKPPRQRKRAREERQHSGNTARIAIYKTGVAPEPFVKAKFDLREHHRWDRMHCVLEWRFTDAYSFRKDPSIKVADLNKDLLDFVVLRVLDLLKLDPSGRVWSDKHIEGARVEGWQETRARLLAITDITKVGPDAVLCTLLYCIRDILDEELHPIWFWILASKSKDTVFPSEDRRRPSLECRSAFSRRRAAATE